MNWLKKVTVYFVYWLATGASAELLVGWDGGVVSESATNRTGISGNLWAGNLFEVDGNVGSTDGSFGSVYNGASATASAYEVRLSVPGSTDRVSVQVMNNTGSSLQLDQLHFDYAAWWSSSPLDVHVSYAYGNLDITDATPVETVSSSSALNGNTGDYEDFDVALAGLADSVLEDGQSATFMLTALNADGATSSGAFDNIAVSGALIVPADATLSVDVSAALHPILKTAMGTGLVYSWYADSMFADGEVSHIIQDIGLGALRWPGGTVVTFYHWDDLNGQGWTDSWNPAYDTANDQAPENYMDLDEYLAVIDETGADIMLGVNMSSGIEWDRETEAIAEASNLMVSCQSKGYDVKHVYFDNENFQPGNNYNRDDDNDGEAWNATLYAQQFNLYAAAVKATFPDAKLIANARNNVTGPAFLSEMQAMLSIAGTNIDLVDLHYYWQWDNASWDLWKTQLPMKRTGSSQTYQDSVEHADAIFSSEGYPDIHPVVLEWNIGPGPWTTDADHNNFKTALMQTEMHMQLLAAGVEVGLLYALEGNGLDPAEDKNVIRNGEPNATALWMWLFSKAAGKTVVSSSVSADGIYGLALQGGDGALAVYLLNKTDSDLTVELDLDGVDVNDISEAWRFLDGGDGEGELQQISLWEMGGNNRTTLKADTLNMILFNDPNPDEPARPEISSSVVMPISDGLLAGWHTASGDPDVAAAGISGELLTGSLFDVDSSAGSTDGSFGTSLDGASTEWTAYAVRGTNGSDAVVFSVVNRSGAPVRLDAIHFDYARWWADSPKDIALVVDSGDLDGVTNGTPVQSAADLPNFGKTGDFDDFDWSLSGLPDQVLAHNEEVWFRLSASNALTAWAAGAFDNIAVSGGTASTVTDLVLVEWRAETGRKYTVMETGNLVSNDWNAAVEMDVASPGTVSVPVELDSPRFYRLDIQ
ncbi:hypothetical protein [Pontiella sulfatireligans]|uniref:hypothetical protein n=1 Tax=Pontiella sulfatireligans TaxID=2750658 RepID=UPI00109D01B1|nr:hypothetical protein [Pontiella sulfatireligans]